MFAHCIVNLFVYVEIVLSFSWPMRAQPSATLYLTWVLWFPQSWQRKNKPGQAHELFPSVFSHDQLDRTDPNCHNVINRSLRASGHN